VDGSCAEEGEETRRLTDRQVIAKGAEKALRYGPSTEGIEAMGELFNWIGELVRWLFQTKARPVASFTVRDQGTRKLPCIRIKNSSEYDIEVKQVCAKP
jgi:hypothetical protein